MEKELRDYQKECLDKALQCNKRGIIWLPCGSGKTFISMKIIESPTIGRAIFFAPTIALLEQTVTNYREHFPNIKMLLCCSGSYQGAGITRTLDELEIECFLRNNEDEKFIVFSTYASCHRVSEVIYKANINFSISFYDEAHKINTENLGDYFLNLARKNIFMTATPTKEMLERPDIFGGIVYRKANKEAVKEGIVKDFQVKCIAMPEEIGEKDNAGILAVLSKNVLERYNLNHSIAFFNTNKTAEMFSNILGQEGYNSKFAWDFPTNACIKNYFSDNEKACISNSRKLSEGLDISSLDAVLILEPKYSPTTVQQIIGRAVRRGGEHDSATIIVPAFLNAQNKFSFGKSAPMMRIISHIKRDAYISILYADNLVKDKYENLKEDRNSVLKEKKVEAHELLTAIEKKESFKHLVKDYKCEDITNSLLSLELNGSCTSKQKVSQKRDNNIDHEVQKICIISMLRYAKKDPIDLSEPSKYPGKEGRLIKNLFRYFWVGSRAEKKEIIACTKQKNPTKNFANYFQKLVWAYRTHESESAKFLIEEFMRKGMSTYYIPETIVDYIKEEFPRLRHNLHNVSPFQDNLQYKKLEYRV